MELSPDMCDLYRTSIEAVSSDKASWAQAVEVEAFGHLLMKEGNRLIKLARDQKAECESQAKRTALESLRREHRPRMAYDEMSDTVTEAA